MAFFVPSVIAAFFLLLRSQVIAQWSCNNQTSLYIYSLEAPVADNSRQPASTQY